jgi:hypothetical protein
VQALRERTEPAGSAAAVASGTGNSYGYAGGGYAERSSLDIASPPQHSTSTAAAASQVRYIDTYQSLIPSTSAVAITERLLQGAIMR